MLTSFCQRSFVCRMSVSADDARAKVIHCEALHDKQKAKMLLLINTEPDITLPVFTGVPDFLLGHTLSAHLEGMTTGTTPTAHAIALYLHTSSALRLLLVTLNIGLQHFGMHAKWVAVLFLPWPSAEWPKIPVPYRCVVLYGCIACCLYWSGCPLIFLS